MEMKLKVSFALLLSYAFLMAFVASAPALESLPVSSHTGLDYELIEVNQKQAVNRNKPDFVKIFGPSEDTLVKELKDAVRDIGQSQYTDGKLQYSLLSQRLAETLKIVKELDVQV